MSLRKFAKLKPLKWISIQIIFALLITGSTACSASSDEQPGPYFSVIPNFQQVHGHHWPLGATLTLEINDPATEAAPDLVATAEVVEAPWDPGTDTWVEFNLSELSETPLDLVKPGNEFTISGGGDVKSLTVQPLFVTFVDPLNNNIGGIAEPGSIVRVDPHPGEPDRSISLTVGEDGAWQANSPAWELLSGVGGDATQWDQDGDSTQFQMRLPAIFASLTDHFIRVSDFSYHAQVTISIDRVGLSQTVRTGDQGEAGIEPQDWDGVEPIRLQAGDVITAIDHFTGLTKTLTLELVSLEEVDFENGLVFGTAEPDRLLYVQVWNEVTDVRVETQSDEAGNWQADFTALLDLTKQMNFSAELPDDDFDFTVAGFEPGEQ